MAGRAAFLGVFILVFASSALPQGDATAIATQIETALGGRRIDQALILWEENSETLLASLPACLKAGHAWANFGGQEEVLRFQDLPDECLQRAMACFDAADKLTIETDVENRVQVARGLLKAGDVYVKTGAGDKAATQQDRARVILEAVAATDPHPAGVHADLGALCGRLADREPPKAEEHIARAAAQYDEERKASGDSAYLCQRIGETRQQLAEMRETLLAKNPKDRALAKGAAEAWTQALASFEQALKAEAKNADLQTAFNECLWEVLRVTEGKAKQKPIMNELKVRYGAIKLKLPASKLWKVTDEGTFKRDDDLLEAVKYSKKDGQALLIWIDRYEWSSTYRNEETGESIGGDNIGGLSRRSEKTAREYFQDVKDTTKLQTIQLSRKIPKAEAFSVKGLTKENNTFEYRCIFFKESARQATFKITVIADLGLLDRNPYELNSILDTIEVVPRK